MTPTARLSRRRWLLAASAWGGATLFPRGGAQPAPSAHAAWSADVERYLRSLARPDGGYAWGDQDRSHLTPTHAVVGSLRLLGKTPPDPETVAAFVRDHHPAQLKKLEQEHRHFECEQIQTLLWLGADASTFHARVRSWQKPTAYLRQYEANGHPVFRSELAAFIGRALLGLSLDDLAPEYVAYLDARRRPDGSFNNTPAAEGGDGHVLNTWWGLQGLRTLGRSGERRDATRVWLQACQRADGGFTHAPAPEIGVGVDLAYTWAAVQALRLLEASPARTEACIRQVWSLWNADGGFGSRPGWPSNPVATYYALDSLAALNALERVPSPRRPKAPPSARLPSGLKVFSLQIEAHGRGSPAEAVDLARTLRLHFWGAKNAAPAWITRAQALADQQRVPVRFFVSNEEYGTWVRVPGLGTYSHTSDILGPAGVDLGPSLANQGVVNWTAFRERRWRPLARAGGRLVWQFGENEELVRLYLDDSLQHGGYAAISTFHFGNPDFTHSEPFLQAYRGVIPFVALQDAHGAEPWWFADMTTGFRTLFLGTEPTWDGWLNALDRNWVVAVRHDAVSRFETWMHGGRTEVLDFVRARERAWRWWDNPDIARPDVSLVAVSPEDAFEEGRPERGLSLRVRCAWENTAQGLPKAPLAELVRLTLDDRVVTPTLVDKKTAKTAARTDHYHLLPLERLSPGPHTATATVRRVATGVETTRALQFLVPA